MGCSRKMSSRSFFFLVKAKTDYLDVEGRRSKCGVLLHVCHNFSPTAVSYQDQEYSMPRSHSAAIALLSQS